jgi:hypothetical protein
MLYTCYTVSHARVASDGVRAGVVGQNERGREWRGARGSAHMMRVV